MRIVLTSGGSGGNIYSLVAVSRKLREKYGNDLELMFVGPKGEFEEKIMSAEGIPSKYILTGKAKKHFSPQNFPGILKISLGLMQSLFTLWNFMPDAVFSKGGYASIPVIIAAWLYRIPILAHESDAIPGVADRIIGKLSKRVAISYPRTQRYFPAANVLLTGNPIRKDVMGGNKEEAIRKLGLSPSLPTILVLGGGQGTKSINNAVISVLVELLKFSQVIHQTGEDYYDEIVKKAAVEGIKAGRGGYYPAPYIGTENLRDSFAVADLVISRAGANSISEIAANGKVALLIPLSDSANSHQSMNAFSLAEAGGALVLEESNLGQHILLEKIQKLLEDIELRKKMSENIKAFYHEDAAEKIVMGIEEIIKK